MYKAHINDTTGKIQTVKEHCEGVARLCRDFAIEDLKDIMYAIGLFHDIGKYQLAFQRRINGENIRVEHSACGAIEAKEKYGSLPTALLMECCISGHHGGIPDMGYLTDTEEMPTLAGRLKRKFDDYSIYKDELSAPLIDNNEFLQFLLRDCDSMDKCIDKFAFITRYCYSCLVDADSLDTAAFMNDEDRGTLKSDFVRCLDKVDRRLQSFICATDLQRARSKLQKEAFEKVNTDGEIFLLQMPTGSGKTLCSIKFALERALLHNKKRIIYVIPYNSIIDQTVKEFESIFGSDAEILRHQSTFSYDEQSDYDEEYKHNARYASENWDAHIIVTTMVQFFESVYSNKRSKLRKLHNTADSIIVFDEAHLMPHNYLQSCLEAVSYLTRYFNSEAVFLTATMPDFKSLIREYGLKNSKIVDLIDDKSDFDKFDKCNYKYISSKSGDEILSMAGKYPSSLIIVNTRKSAQQLYKSIYCGKKFHLSTYMTAFDREKTISKIKCELEKLEKDYPDFADVPEERRITVISTSLIEAGVDLDFYTVFRELSGLDSILQAGGRCNREGKREKGEVFIFELKENEGKVLRDVRPNITKGILQKYSNISSSESIEEYYRMLFYTNKDLLEVSTMHRYCSDIYNIPFKKYADEFEIIDSKTISIVTAQDERSRRLVREIQCTGKGSERSLQRYAFSVYQNEFDSLLAQNVVDDFGSGIWCLTNNDYYDKEMGITFEAKDYIV